jgi:hypothetical protein
MSQDIHYESTPGGGVRIQTDGIELKVTREAIERAERVDGIAFNVSLTGHEHEALDMLDADFQGKGSPIETIMHFRAMLRPSDGVSND